MFPEGTDVSEVISVLSSRFNTNSLLLNAGYIELSGFRKESIGFRIGDWTESAVHYYSLSLLFEDNTTNILSEVGGYYPAVFLISIKRDNLNDSKLPGNVFISTQ